LKNKKRANEREIIKAEQKAESLLIEAQASFRDEQTKAKSRAEKMIQEATSKKNNAARQIDQWKAEQLMESENQLLFAQNQFKILQMNVQAKANENLKGAREQEIRMALYQEHHDETRQL